MCGGVAVGGSICVLRVSGFSGKFPPRECDFFFVFRFDCFCFIVTRNRRSAPLHARVATVSGMDVRC